MIEKQRQHQPDRATADDGHLESSSALQRGPNVPSALLDLDPRRNDSRPPTLPFFGEEGSGVGRR